MTEDDIFSRLSRIDTKLSDLQTSVQESAFATKQHSKDISKISDSIESVERDLIPDIRIAITALQTKQTILAGVFGTIGGILASSVFKGMSG